MKLMKKIEKHIEERINTLFQKGSEFEILDVDIIDIDTIEAKVRLWNNDINHEVNFGLSIDIESLGTCKKTCKKIFNVELQNVKINGKISATMTGNVYGHERFKDGHFVQTSEIEKIDFIHKVVETKNSIYNFS